MRKSKKHIWIPLNPSFDEKEGERQLFRIAAEELITLAQERTDDESVNSRAGTILSRLEEKECSTTLSAAVSVLVDLTRQKWILRLARNGQVEVQRPAIDNQDPTREKARIRNQELVKRNEQLGDPSIAKFIDGVVNRRGGQSSIYNLIRDGRELAESMRDIRGLSTEARPAALRKVIDPYLQFVEPNVRCEHTSILLNDIWRYFRHTWTNQYASTPGRTMAYLVRDKSQRHHPIIGIGALGSPIVQIKERDEWLGWHPDTFLESIKESPSKDIAKWLNGIIDKAIIEVYISDLLADGLLTVSDIDTPSTTVIDRLVSFSIEQRDKHHRFFNSHEMRKESRRHQKTDNTEHWKKRSESHLYKSKRAISLADMLGSRLVIQKYLNNPVTNEQIHQLLESDEGVRTIKKVLRKAKADRVGIAMADITVCGAISPYSPLLAGKLVSMLSASPEVIESYQRKYLQQESEIASSMAGRPIVRPSDLVFLGTTSLYGIGSSQYNRLRMPAEVLGGDAGERLEYLEIGRSGAFGTSHFSASTVNALVNLVQQSRNGMRVNSVFGEGVSPKLRKIREGLSKLNFSTDSLLQHGRARIIYGVPLARNIRDYLIGIDDKPDYIFNTENTKESTDAIVDWWFNRWLCRRIDSDEVLNEVNRHTKIHDGRYLIHGACVRLTKIDDGQMSLFDD